MRKVLSFVLVLSLVLGSFGMAFAATTPSNKKLSDIDGLACEDAVRVLANLNVVSGYEDGTYKPEQTVTRAEMASLIINALGLKETNAVPKFADSKTHWAKGYIAYANTLGIISGRSETVFDPDATVTYDEATTMLVKALGYTDEALNGTYPASFVSRARVLGILDGVQTGSGGANRGDVAIMLYQTLDQAIGKVDKDGNFQETVIEWSKTSGNASTPKKYDTMLDRLGAEIASKDNLKGAAKWDSDIDEDAFIVSGDEDTIINITPYKGAAVSAYVNDDGDIIAIKEVFTTFITGAFGDARFDTDTTFTLADGTEYTMKQDAVKDIGAGTIKSGDAITFLNGDEKSLTETTLQNGGDSQTKAVYTLSVELSGKKITDIHSVLKWEATEDAKIKSEDIDSITSSQKLLGIKFAKDDNGDIDKDSFDLVGVKSLEDIKADNVVYVYKNNDNEISRIAVGAERPTGVVSKLNSGETKVTIDGNTYKYTSKEMEGNKVDGAVATGKIDTDDEVTLYLDAYGYIYDTKKVSGSADKFAIVLTAGKTAGLKGGDPQVELLLADGTTKIFDVNKDVKDKSPLLVDNDGKWKADALNYVTKGAIVKYGLDKSGEITTLYVATSPSAVGNGSSGKIGAIPDEDLEFYADLTAKNKISSKGYFDGKEIATDAVIFDYDESNFTTWGKLSDDDDDYSVAKYDSVLDSDEVNAYYVYDTDKKEVVAMLLDGAGSSNNVFGVVAGNGKNNSDAGAYFNMFIDGKDVSYNGDDALVSKNDRMDLVFVKFDGNGDISDFYGWNHTTDKVQYVSTGSLSADMKTNVYSDNTFKFANSAQVLKNGGEKDKTTNGALLANGDRITLDKSVVVYTYDRVDEEWQIGSKSDLNDLRKGDWAKFYDVDDEDGVYDIVLIYQSPDGRTPSGGSSTPTGTTFTTSSGIDLSYSNNSITKVVVKATSGGAVLGTYRPNDGNTDGVSFSTATINGNTTATFSIASTFFTAGKPGVGIKKNDQITLEITLADGSKTVTYTAQ